MWFTLALSALALAEDPLPPVVTGTLVVDARLPVEVRVDGQPVLQLFVPGRAEIRVLPGDHAITAVTGANPTEIRLNVPQPGQSAVLLVGRNGITSRVEQSVASNAADVSVELRVTGPGPVQVRLDDHRWEIAPGSSVSMSQPVGAHTFSVRSREGTAIWANGSLSLAGGDPVVIQLSEGRAPEVSGLGSYFSNGG